MACEAAGEKGEMDRNASAGTSRRRQWAGYLLSSLVVVFLLMDGAMKLVPLDIVIETSRQLGIPADHARLLGVLTLGCTILYAVPRTAVLGAILMTGYLGGAVATHVRAGSPLFTHVLFGVYLGIVMWGGLYLRNERLRALIPFSL